MFMCGSVPVRMCVGKVMYDWAAQQRKEDKKKAEKVKMLNEPDPEKTRKWEVCVCFRPSLVSFQNPTTWQCIGERTP